jgi:phenylpropionate dioxygenase-like ring-hydroxylating dioxygenase large terminal subunit
MPDDLAESSTETAPAAAPREAWYAALASQRLAQKPVGARVLDRDLVLWRDAAGVAHAAQDRCAHRGAQLSLGEVTDGALACRYHGWRYGADGACVHIPSLAAGQTIPRGVAVRAFPCAERDGYVFAWMGEGAPASDWPAPIAEFERFNWLQGALTLEAEALAVIENNLDWCHPVFAHPYTHGQFFMNQAMGFQELDIEARLTERGLVVFFPPTAEAEDPIPDAPWVALAFELPDRVTVSFAGSIVEGSRAARAVDPQAAPRQRALIVMHLVPTGATTCRQEWMVSIGPAANGAPSVQWTDECHPIFEQDKLVLESVQRAVAREGHGFERSVEADQPTLLVRRIYAAAAQRMWPAACDRLTRRRILRVRS